MRVLLTACPMFGHVNPMLPLALAARRAGHEVVLATGADQVGRVERAGITAWAVGPTFAEAGGPPRSPLDFVAAADKRCVDLLPRVETWRPDVVVHEETEAAGAIVAVRTGARHVTHGLGIAVGGADVFLPILDDLGALVAGRRSRRRRHGGALPVDLPAPLGTPAWSDPRPLRPALAKPDPGERLPASVAALPFERTVHLTLGTVFGTLGALAAAAAGLRELPMNVVVTTGPLVDPAELGPQPGHVAVERYLSHGLLLPRCALVVSQGGAGVLLGALAHGVPQLVLPQAADQFANAEAVERAGVGLALGPDAVTAERVADAARRLLDDPAFAVRARAVGREIAAMPDADALVGQL